MAADREYPFQTRLSRPCYDKPRRCPGWAGGGMMTAKRWRCGDGTARPLILGFRRCKECGVIVLPYMVRWADWRWLRYWRTRNA